MDNNTHTDALVTADDVSQIKAEVDRADFRKLVYELVAREPELGILISEKYDYITTMLDGAGLSVRQRGVLYRQLPLLFWAPVIVLDRAHRRGWNDFLPSEEVIDQPGEKRDESSGGAA